jgi:hypothetical protein
MRAHKGLHIAYVWCVLSHFWPPPSNLPLFIYWRNETIYLAVYPPGSDLLLPVALACSSPHREKGLLGFRYKWPLQGCLIGMLCILQPHQSMHDVLLSDLSYMRADHCSALAALSIWGKVSIGLVPDSLSSYWDFCSRLIPESSL